jgi:lactoylglutathione lyase
MTPVIDHVAVYVHDLNAVRGFYEKYFGALSGEQYHNPSTGLRTYFLSFAAGARLELMTRPGVESNPIEGQVGWAHVAFSVGSPATVDELTALLRHDGFSIVSGPRTTGDGYYESCVLDPEGNRVEITA